MKNQYFGDVGDYGKYAMLRYLADDGINIAVNWYLTEDDGSNDGKFTSYLDKEDLRRYDTALFDVLKSMVYEGNRSVAAFEAVDVIKNAKYYSDILSDDKKTRLNWHKKGLEVCSGVDLVFMDPDNGATESQTAKNSSKYCLPEEIVDYYNRGQNVVYYCQKARRTYEQWEEAKGLMNKYLPDCKIFVITYHKGTQRSYIFVLHKEDYRRYATLMTKFCRKWNRIFSEESFGNGKISGGSTGEKFHVVNSRGVELTIEEMEDGTVRMKRSDLPNQTTSISIDYFMDRLK